jgi:argininosuccinate lyase
VLEGASFRDAYRAVGNQIQNGTYRAVPSDLVYSHEGSIGNLCNTEIAEEMEKVIAGFGFSHIDAALTKLCRTAEVAA